MTAEIIKTPEPRKREFLPINFNITGWNVLEPFFEELKGREINSPLDLEKWMADRDEMEAFLSENLAWRYIKMNIETTDKKLCGDYEFFMTEIQPKTMPYGNFYDEKLISSPFLKNLDSEKYRIYLRSVKKRMEIFREKNVSLLTKIETDAQKYRAISSRQMVEINGEEVTMQKAASFLKNTNRDFREEVFVKLTERRMKDADELNNLFTHLLNMRNQAALNAGFKNYRDYMFASLGRFDYSVADCENFHSSIQKEIVPIIGKFNSARKEKLKLNKLKPWDLDVDVTGKAPLKPFLNAEELTQKTIECFENVDPYFAGCVEIMKQMNRLDLDSKKGKAPGGFQYPLYESVAPFIFMNAVGTLRDVVTLVHEGGHAIHSFLEQHHELVDFKSTPSEVAELASMSMELISMEHWETFFKVPEELKRAKREQLEKILTLLPWIAIVDKFQHWVYENPEHSLEARAAKWREISDSFSSGVVDWSGFEESKKTSWHAQLHIFEVPFYYIEYGMAQLGAIAVWRNYKLNPRKALEQYKAALSLGYTKSIGEIYETAGIKFDFSKEYVKELADFVRGELDKIEA